ncbi:MAG TPA: DEAD/DEAH box helicase [Chloroflexaceae bacterium]|nr:DEAD/DEAH box helicase [Chloroflexaceae bacterium]
MNFSAFELHPTLHANLRAQGFERPTPIQAEAIPPALAGKNVIGLAQTGTGKTAAFVLPILQRLIGGRRGGVRALIVTPTRELAEQVNAAVQALGRGTGLRSAAIYGGVGMEPQERALRAGLDIVVACPGRLLDHLGRGSARLGQVELLVLDEADRMLDMGFLPDIRRVIAALPARRQTMLFSATLSPELKGLAAATAPGAVTVQIGQVRPAHTVEHALYPVPQHHKTALLLELLGRADSGSVLVFTRTKHRANRLMQQLARAGHSAAALHSNRSQNQRQVAMDGFRAGRFRVLVATDIAARGLDVERVSHVINYDVPDTPDAYIHRIGRTGRAERSGEAFTLVTPEDADQVRAIERAVGHPLERRSVAGFDYAAPPPPQQEQPGRRQGPGPRRDQRPAAQQPPRRDQRPAQRGEAPRELRREVGAPARRDQRPARRSA